MNNYCVMYDYSDVIVCLPEDVKQNKSIGFKVYKYAATELEAARLSEACCYLPL